MIYHLSAIILIAGWVSSRAAEFVGTSPCGVTVREFIGISETEPCDKITWRLDLLPEANTFTLNATYGLQEQSAPGFVDGAKTVTLKGALKITGTLPKQTYTIKPDQSERVLSLRRVNDNLLQLLGPDNKSLIGNEFWSYTLNRKGAGKNR
jgi:hypothetical protein